MAFRTVLAGVLLAGLCAALAASGAAAQVLKIPLNKYRLVRLDRDPAAVMIADPTVIDPVVDPELGPRMVFLRGLRIGETNIYILDESGRAILVRDVQVISDEPSQVSVTRGSRAEVTLTCAPRCRSLRTPGAGTGADGQRAAAPAAGRREARPESAAGARQP